MSQTTEKEKSSPRKYSEYTTIEDVLRGGKGSYTQLMSLLADGDLGGFFFGTIGEFGYYGSYFDLDLILQKQQAFYKIKPEYFQRLLAFDTRRKITEQHERIGTFNVTLSVTVGCRTAEV